MDEHTSYILFLSRSHLAAPGLLLHVGVLYVTHVTYKKTNPHSDRSLTCVRSTALPPHGPAPCAWKTHTAPHLNLGTATHPCCCSATSLSSAYVSPLYPLPLIAASSFHPLHAGSPLPPHSLPPPPSRPSRPRAVPCSLSSPQTALSRLPLPPHALNAPLLLSLRLAPAPPFHSSPSLLAFHACPPYHRPRAVQHPSTREPTSSSPLPHHPPC